MRLVVLLDVTDTQKVIDDVATDVTIPRAVFRFKVPANIPGGQPTPAAAGTARKALYAQPNLVTPQAPGAYQVGGVDNAEIALLQSGAYVERPWDGIDVPWGAPPAQLGAVLKQAYQDMQAAWLAEDNRRLRMYGTAYDEAGAAWTVRSA